MLFSYSPSISQPSQMSTTSSDGPDYRPGPSGRACSSVMDTDPESNSSLVCIIVLWHYYNTCNVPLTKINSRTVKFCLLTPPYTIYINISTKKLI